MSLLLPRRGENSPTQVPTPQESSSSPKADLQHGMNRLCSVEKVRGKGCQSGATSKYNHKFWIMRRERKRERDRQRDRAGGGEGAFFKASSPPELETCVCEDEGSRAEAKAGLLMEHGVPTLNGGLCACLFRAASGQWGADTQGKTMPGTRLPLCIPFEVALPWPPAGSKKNAFVAGSKDAVRCCGKSNRRGSARLKKN